MPKLYLGDSVYVDDGKYELILTTDDGNGPSNTIFMNLDVVDALVRYCTEWQSVYSKGANDAN